MSAGSRSAVQAASEQLVLRSPQPGRAGRSFTCVRSQDRNRKRKWAHKHTKRLSRLFDPCPVMAWTGLKGLAPSRHCCPLLAVPSAPHRALIVVPTPRSILFMLHPFCPRLRHSLLWVRASWYPALRECITTAKAEYLVKARGCPRLGADDDVTSRPLANSLRHCGRESGLRGYPETGMLTIADAAATAVVRGRAATAAASPPLAWRCASLTSVRQESTYVFRPNFGPGHILLSV
jgi:hypothetical protein